MHRVSPIVSHLLATRTPSSRSTSTRSSSSSLTCHATAAAAASSTAVQKHVVIADEVASALREGRPVVALESTIISHGMPYPDNLSTALQVETVARKQGVTPATIAILDGVVYVGLNSEKLEKLAKLGESCHKCSRRDLATIIAKRENGATTVAATMYIAHLVGIKIFVTGGIGGVHRGVESTMDISADLNELGRTPVTVVCAGVKSILDIGRTLEYLETQGTSVISYGTTQFPAFFTPDSGFRSPLTCHDTLSCARVIATSHDMQLTSGIVIAVPIPKEHAAVSEQTEKATQQALQEANQKRISGRDITPFLLQRINELTGGESLKANIALIKNNVLIGSRIAVDLSQLQKPSISSSPTTMSTPSPKVR